MAKDYYKILGVEKEASKGDIKKAFRKLAHKYHPDKKGGDESKFKEVNEAYSVLSDEKKRQEYDAYGNTFAGGAEQGFGGFDFSQFSGQSGRGFEGFDFADIFGDMFGGSRTTRQERRGRDISIDIEIPFAEAVFGTERKVLLTKASVCDVCGGDGAKKGTELKTCNACNGKGQVHDTRQSIFGSFSTIRQCAECHGSGKVPLEKCSNCQGSGVVKKQEEIKIAVPPGISHGEMIRMTGLGEAVSRGVPGDLYVKVHVVSHPVFRKEGFNLVMNLDVKLTDALLGAEYGVETLDGTLKIKIPEGTTFGDTLRIKGKGVPAGRGRGDLLIKVQIRLPGKLSRKAKQALQDLRQEGI